MKSRMAQAERDCLSESEAKKGNRITQAQLAKELVERNRGG